MSEETFPGAPTELVVDPSLRVANLVAEQTIAGNVTRYMQHMAETAAATGVPETILREQQLPVFADIAVFLASDSERGHVILPTGGGKTVLQAEAANAIFYGTEPGDPDRPKLLILVPRLKLADQTIGEYDEETGEPIGGLAKFAPGLTASRYTGDEKDLSGDVVVMTYDALRGAIKKGVTLPKFKVVMPDEAHRSLGEKTRGAVDVVSEGAKVLAFTATPDFDELKSVRVVYGEKVHEISLREGIGLGMLSKLQVWSYKTNIKLNVPKRDGNFNMDELEPLLRHEGRNRAAVEVAANYVAQGVQGLISCIPGEKTQHAIDMAKLLNGREIVDTHGVRRNIVARAVSGDMDPEELKNIYRDYRAGKIDVLTFVDLLKEGFDAPNAKFMVNLRPTKSPVDAVQRLGRILRLFKEGSIAQIVEFLDDYEGATSYTAYHALGDLEAPLNNGHIYGGSQEDNERIAAGGIRENPFDMSAVADMIASCELEVLSELYLGPAEREQRRDIRDGRLITVTAALARIAELGGRASYQSVVDHIGSVAVPGSKDHYVWVDALTGIMDRYIAKEDDIDYATVSGIVTERLHEAFGNDINWRMAKFEEDLRMLATQTRKFKAANSRNESIVWNRSELEHVLDSLLTPFAPGEYQDIFDYYHNDEGRQVAYDRKWFGASRGTALKLIEGALAAMDPEQRRDALRLKISDYKSVEFIYSQALLAAAADLKRRYINRPQR